ncbi:hypothetical protein HAZT_HAZT005973 [Hyalella azteca]|uniref:Proteasome subunit beta type-1 n=1 Tax=Hyalella azteca TaxID=294128 RepID=A0A6A0HBS8_HYAAZ|nr:hypothetical protein HAZT_HAZT005973 [Hyalella azteca]
MKSGINDNSLPDMISACPQLYSQEHHDEMSTPAIAQLVSTVLYWRRFFPYYVSNMVIGLDEDGSGVVYHYDPVGHMEKLRFSSAGASVAQIQPLLDNQLGALNMKDAVPPKALAHQLMHDAFISAAERDVKTGDSCIIYTVTKDGVAEEQVKLRRD